jgi:hypothetical protein
MLVAPELHVPPVTVSVSEVVSPLHILVVPLILPVKGLGFMVITIVALAVPQPLLTL